MKKILSAFALSSLPALVLASGAAPHEQGMHDKTHAETTASSQFGEPGDSAKVNRSIEVVMEDSLRFVPDNIKVRRGETIRFVVRNAGKIPHEMVIGSREELEEHAAQMRKMPQMKHSEPNALALEAGRSGSLVWHFDRPGKIEFACLVPGHMEGGMVGTILVE